jgi:hypothetical protein
MSGRPGAVIDLDTLKLGLPGMAPELGAFYSQASRVCFYHHGHPNGVVIVVTGDFVAQFGVVWSEPVTSQVLNSWRDEQEMTEFGAIGVAILLMLELTPYTVIRRAVLGDGVDYWLGYRNSEAPFQGAARLEISGILRGDAATIRSRVRAKEQQATATSKELPAHIIVVEFSAPAAYYTVKP